MVRDGESKVTVWLSSASEPPLRVRNTTLEPECRRPGSSRTATSLPRCICFASASADDWVVRTVRAVPSTSTVTGNARRTSTWSPSCSVAVGDGGDGVARGAGGRGDREERADGLEVGAHLLAGAVDHQGHLGASGGEQPAAGPTACEHGGDDEQGDEQHPGRRSEPGWRRHGAGGRRGALSHGSSVTGGSPSGLGRGSQVAASCGSARAGDGAQHGFGRGEGVGHQGLGLGDHRGLHLGVRIEQGVHRREVVDVVGQRQPRRRVVRLGAGR